MEAVLAIATILGGITAIWFFWDKFKGPKIVETKEIELLKEEMLLSQKRLEGLQTGGNTFCYWMLYHFDLEKNLAYNFVIIRKGEYPLYDLNIRIHNMDSNKEVMKINDGELNSPASYRMVQWKLPNEIYYRVFFHARNGSWHQDLILKKSVAAQCWLAASVVKGNKGEILLEHLDNSFAEEFGQPVWKE